MDEQQYFEQSLYGLDLISEYSKASKEANERTATATESMANSVSDFIKQYQKAATKKEQTKKTKGDATGIGGTVSDFITAAKKFDEPTKAQGDNLVEFLTKLNTDVISKHAETNIENFNSTISVLMETVGRIDSMLKTASKITPTTAETLALSVSKILSGFDKITPDSAQAFNLIVDTLSKNVLNLGQSLSKSIPYYIKAQISVPMVASTLRRLLDIGKETGMKPEDAEVMAKVVETLSNNVLVLGQSLARSAKFYKAAEPALPIIGRVITNLITTLYDNLGGKEDLERAMLAAQTIEVLSRGIFGLSKALAISAPLMILALPGALAFRGVMMIMNPALRQLAANAANIREGSNAVRHMAMTMLLFSGSMALSAVILRTLDSSDIPKFLALFGAMGVGALMYGVIGNYSNTIIKGSLSVLAMAGTTWLFSLAVKAAVENVPDPLKVGLLALEIGALALTYGIIGSFMGNILMGSLAMGAVGVSLWILSNPLQTIAGVLSENADVLWKLPVLIVGLGAAYAAAGIPVVAGFILLGAAAIAAIGGSLLLIASGLKKITEVNMTPEQAENIKYAIKGVVEGFSEGFSGLSVKEAITLPPKIAGVAAMGLSLRALAGGIGAWKEKAGDWSKADTNQLVYSINSISKAFATAGSSEGQTKIFGFKVGKNDAQRGIDSTMKMGRNLKKLAEGIGAWKEMDLSQEDMQLISDNVLRVLTTIPNVFSAIGKAQREDSSNQMSVLGVRFGVPFTKTDVELGISSTMKIGQNLKNLADGISAWKDMELTPEVLQVITDNITRVLSTIPNIFASIGKAQREDSANQTSFLGVTFGIPFTKTDVELGIDATMKMGTNLKTLADGVLAWKEGGEAGLKMSDLENIENNILHVLAVIPSAFAKIGQTDRETEKGILWWKKGDIERGAEIFEKVTPTIKSVSDLVLGFKDVPDVTAYATNIGDSVGIILTKLSAGLDYYDDSKVKILKELPKPLGELTKVFKEWGEIFKTFKDIDFAKVEEAAVLALKLDRIQRGLAYEEVNVETDGGLQTKNIETKPKQKSEADIAAAAKIEAENSIMSKLLQTMQGMQDMIAMNTLAMNEMKEFMMSGVIKTKEVSNHEF